MATGEGLPDALDLSSYDLETLRDDVRAIVDVGGAISRVVRWAAGAVVVVGVIAWLVFGARLDSGFATFVVAIVAAALAAPAGAAIGAWLLARQRLDVVTQASGKVVGVVGEMHADVTRLREGHAQTSVQKVAVSLVEEAIVPAVFGTATSVAEGMLGPLGFLAEQAAKPAMALVQRTVVAAIGAMPDRTIGQIAEQAVDSATAATPIDAVIDTVRDDYSDVKANLTSTVEKVSRTSLRVAMVATVLAMLPLLLWLVLVWVIT